MFAEMFARLGDKIADAVEQLVAHPVPVGHAPLVENTSNLGIEVLAVALELEVEGHVVDPGTR
jgi:hypothetical protein